MTKFCKDCKYYKDHRGYAAAVCLHTSSQTSPILVTGEFYYSSCKDQRRTIAGCCTEQAIFFEPKKPLTPPPTTEYVKTRSSSWFKTFWR